MLTGSVSALVPIPAARIRMRDGRPSTAPDQAIFAMLLARLPRLVTDGAYAPEFARLRTAAEASAS